MPLEPENRLSDLESNPIPDENQVTLLDDAPGDPVTDEMILNDGTNPEGWLSYNKGLEQTGYSPADRLTTDNIGDLSLAYTVDTVPGLGDCVGQGQEANPTIVPGDPPVMYLSAGAMQVTALNARTGDGYWTSQVGIPEIDAAGVRNRGAAVYGDYLVAAFPDETDVYPRMIGWDRYTGQQVWETNMMTPEQQVVVPEDRLFTSQMPLTYDGKAFIGQSSDKASWTHVQAYDVATGDRLWNYQIGKPHRWVGDTWMFSSGAAWMTPSLDPESDTLFFSTTNPDPMMNSVIRPGPNEETQAIIALDPSTGEEKWTHQMLPHEAWDYDAATSPMVFDMEVDGEPRRVVAEAGKVGWLYIIDVETGELLQRSEGLGRQDHGPAGFLQYPPAGQENMEEFWPQLAGVKEWPTDAYSPNTGLYYCGSNDTVMLMAYDPDWAYDWDREYTPAFAIGGFFGFPEDAPVKGRVVAVDPASGDIQWRHTLDDIPTDSPAGYPFTGGTTATAGGIVFHGSSGGNLVALHEDTGDLLWSHDTGGRIAAQPVVWDDPDANTQFVAVASMQELYVYSLST